MQIFSICLQAPARFWPRFIDRFVLQQVFVTFRRIDDLLTMEEMEIYYRPPNKTDNAVEFENFTGAWDVVEKTQVWRILLYFEKVNSSKFARSFLCWFSNWMIVLAKGYLNSVHALKDSSQHFTPSSWCCKAQCLQPRNVGITAFCTSLPCPKKDTIRILLMSSNQIYLLQLKES